MILYIRHQEGRGIGNYPVDPVEGEPGRAAERDRIAGLKAERAGAIAAPGTS